LRHGELLGLRWEDVEIKEGEGRLSVRRALVQSRPKGSGGTGYAFGTPKTGRARVVSFGAKVAALLREHRKQQVKEKLALGPRYHDLPHTAAALPLQEGVHPRIVQEMLGHSKISQTLDTYSHVLPNMQAEAARRLDSALF
jgi:integrase